MGELGCMLLIMVTFCSIMLFFGFPTGNENAGEIGLLIPALFIVGTLALITVSFVLKSGKELKAEVPSTEPVVKAGSSCAWIAAIAVILILILCGMTILSGQLVL